MACPGGCIGGGGQPRSKDKEILRLRQEALYSVDAAAAVRRSHESPLVKHFYDEHLGAPGSALAKQLLHTTYQAGGAPKFDLAAAAGPPAGAEAAAAAAAAPPADGPACGLPEAEVCMLAEKAGPAAAEDELCGCAFNVH